MDEERLEEFLKIKLEKFKVVLTQNFEKGKRVIANRILNGVE